MNTPDSTHGGRLLRCWDCETARFVTVTWFRFCRAKRAPWVRRKLLQAPEGGR